MSKFKTLFLLLVLAILFSSCSLHKTKKPQNIVTEFGTIIPLNSTQKDIFIKRSSYIPPLINHASLSLAKTDISNNYKECHTQKKHTNISFSYKNCTSCHLHKYNN